MAKLKKAAKKNAKPVKGLRMNDYSEPNVERLQLTIKGHDDALASILELEKIAGFYHEVLEAISGGTDATSMKTRAKAALSQMILPKATGAALKEHGDGIKEQCVKVADDKEVDMGPEDNPKDEEYAVAEYDRVLMENSEKCTCSDLDLGCPVHSRRE